MAPSKPSLGRLLRSLRRRRGWTLKEMSERTGIPLSTLSKVEHDRLSLSYDRLYSLSQKLNMGMSELFAEPEDDSLAAVTARRSLGRLADAVRIETPNYEYFYLCPELRHKRMMPVLARVLARSIEEFGELVRHSGEEFTQVLSGRVHFHTEFYDPVTLETGESVYIDSSMGHAFTLVEGCQEADILFVCSSAEEAPEEGLLNLGEAFSPHYS